MATDPAIPVPIKTKTLKRGDSRAWVEEFRENTGTASAPVAGDPINMSGWEWLMEVRSDLNRGDLLATFTVDDSDAANGNLAVLLPSDEADGLPGQDDPGTLPVVYCDLQGTRTSDGFRKTWKTWWFKVSGDSSNE